MALDDKEWNKKLKFYDKIISLNSNFERKGKTMPYTSANGHMFTLFNKAGEIGFRFSKEAGKIFLEKYPDSLPYKSYGSFMNGYILIPESMYEDLDLIEKYLEESYQFVLTLKPK
ncbi:MAG: hypothetical protein BalsKO_14740 [Balneolaceae bacterium]